MTYFAAVLARSGQRWQATEVSLEECESLADLGDVARDVPGELRLLLVEQDDEYAALIRVDEEDDPRAFLSDGHAADLYPVAAVIAEELRVIREDAEDEDELDGPPLDVLDDADFADPAVQSVHESAPLGDAEIADDLGTSAADLLAMCAHEGTLPIDLLVAICEKAGCGPIFEDIRA